MTRIIETSWEELYSVPGTFTTMLADVIHAWEQQAYRLDSLDHIPPETAARYADDRRLVERATTGDHGAFRQLFDTYAPLVYRVAFRMVGSPDDAADLTQDVFVRAYERLHTLKDGQAFQAWITRLTVNLAHDRGRRRRLDTLSLDAPPPGRDETQEWAVPDTAPGQDSRLLTAEQTAVIQQALLTLSPEHRAVVILHHLEEMPVEHIAQVVGVPVGTVKSRLARARADLKRKLAAYFLDTDPSA